MAADLVEPAACDCIECTTPGREMLLSDADHAEGGQESAGSPGSPVADRGGRAVMGRQLEATEVERPAEVKELDAVQLMMQKMKAVLGSEAAHRNDRHALDMETMEEQLNLSKEALRIAEQRLQQQALELMRHKKEASDLKLQLTVERHRLVVGGAGLAQMDSQRVEMSLRKTIIELQQERNQLVHELEISSVQHQSQLEELERGHIAKTNEMQQKFDQKIAELQENFEAVLKQKGKWLSQPRTYSLESQDSTGHIPELTEQLRSSGQGACLEACPGEPHKDLKAESTAIAAHEADRRPSASLQSAIWSVVSLMPRVAAVFCRLNGLKIRRVTQQAITLFGGELSGKTLYDLLHGHVLAFKLERALKVKQALADQEGAEVPGFITYKMGEHELKTISQGASFRATISVAHVGGESSQGEDKGILVIFCAGQQSSLRQEGSLRALFKSGGGRSDRSTASSDVAPSDSISVTGCKNPKKLTGDVQRALRASFFSVRKSNTSTPAPSSRNSPRSPRSISGI
eukprot:gb/GFBE01068874.1/.p1 GENE.gb/GFBE01068874.1/~~gb/GFBE01068874.1/.p1  ORF type:complete len:518 (+),score=87.79 gb/GFBE01068874.1/:1-1554(+)